MPPDLKKEPTALDHAIAIRDEINKLIPLAANRFEEFECPLKGEHARDIDIQYHLHESLSDVMLMHNVAIEELTLVYQEALKTLHLKENITLSEHDRNNISSMLNGNLIAMYSRLERIFRLKKKFDASSFDVAKQKLFEILQASLTDLFTKGVAALEINETMLIAHHIETLEKNVLAVAKKIRDRLPITKAELRLVDIYRREGVPHEDDVNRLYDALNVKCHNPKFDVSYQDATVEAFENDAFHNIKKLSEKLAMRKHSYATRYECNKKLVEIRDNMRSNVDFTHLENILKILPMSMESKTEMKSLNSVTKSYYFQMALYLEMNRCDTGYCDEHACLALMHLINNYELKDPRIEKVSIRYADEDGHTFIVIDRAKASELHDMTTWGEKAILLDAWHQLACYAKDLPSHEREFTSFPSHGTWSSIEFSGKDQPLLRQLKQMDSCFSVTGNTNPETREIRLIEEYALQEIVSTSYLHQFMTDVIRKHQPAKFNYNVKFYTTNNGNDLVRYIPGFRDPVIAINHEVIVLLLAKKLSLTALEFSVVTILLQLKMYTSFISPLSISHESQQKIDIQAMQQISSTTASIDFLRCAAEFHKKKSSRIMVTIDKYEYSISSFNVKEITSFTYAERIKVLQTSLAAGLTKQCETDIEFPSPEFHNALANTGKRSDEVEQSYIDVDLPTPVTEKTATVTSEPKPRQENIVAPIQPSEVVAPTTPIITPVVDHSQARIKVLKKLIAAIPDLAIEILPYENYNAPSIRLRQFAKVLMGITVDYNNSVESELVDQLVDKANEMKIPGFEYLYHALTNRWGVANRKEISAHCVKSKPKEYRANSYYLITTQPHVSELFYTNEYCVPISVDINDVPDLKEFLEKNDLHTKELDDHRKDITFILEQFQKLRPLGFFKKIQNAITAFTVSATFDEAMQNARELVKLREDYKEHLDDQLARLRKCRIDCDKIDATSKTPERFYGNDLGKRIQWKGFELSPDVSIASETYRPFLNWCAQDSTGLISATLFRLGWSNLDEVLFAMTPKDLDYVSECRSYSTYVFFGKRSGPHALFFRFREFGQLRTWIEECRSKKHCFKSEMLSDVTLSFEDQFKQFFDYNFPVLIHPNLQFNAKQEAIDCLLARFYQIALTGSLAEQDVVKSFFYGREDKRDLPSLLNSARLGIDSPYFKFILLQTFNSQGHHLFDDYDLKTLDELRLFTIDKKTSLEHYQMILRAPDESNLEKLFTSLLDLSFKLDLNWHDEIIDRYLIVYPGKIDIFNPSVIKIIGICSQPRNYYSTQIRVKLNDAVWPSFENNRLEAIDITTLLLLYSQFDYETIFPNYETKSKFGMVILNRIMELTDLETQISHLETWFFSGNSKLSLSDVPLKNIIIDQLINRYLQRYGKDDGSIKYHDKVQVLIIKLFDKLTKPDLNPFMTKLLTTIEAQKKLSDFVGMNISPEDYKLESSKHLKKKSLVHLIKCADYFGREAGNQKALLDFLVANLNQTSLNTMIDYIEKYVDLDDFGHHMGWSLRDYDSNPTIAKEKTQQKIHAQLMQLYYQFWNCSLIERAAITEQVLIPASQTLSVELQNHAYEMGITFISSKIFPRCEDPTTDDYLALTVLKSYLHTADTYIRSYLLAGMLVAAKNSENKTASIGKKLVVICEHMGPAYVKLAQAIHSHPNTSDEIRADLAHVKGKANPPTRWALWRQMAEVLPPAELAKIKRVGSLLGSASYNLALDVVLQDGSQVVLLLLREGAEESVKKGFAHIRATILHCPHEAVVRQRNMIAETIDEAARLSKNEMDKEASDKQSALAEQLYPKSMSFTVDGKQVAIAIATSRIINSGKGYRFIDRVYGEEFNNLPDSKIEDRFLKQAVSKAVITMELHNIFRGGPFDSDRHGNQLRLQVQNQDSLNLHLGLYDFGEMALDAPSTMELKQLVDVLNQIPLCTLFGKNMDHAISNRIDIAVKQNESTHYLMRLRKAFLALHDFQQYLSHEDLMDVISSVAKQSDLHPLLAAPVGKLAVIAVGGTFIKNSFPGLSNLAKQFGLFGHSPTWEINLSQEDTNNDENYYSYSHSSFWTSI